MKRIAIFALGGKKPIIENAGMTENFAERFMGLMLKREMDLDALAIAPCSSIHMFFMRFPIDAVFVDGSGRILAVEEGLRPWRVSGLHRGAGFVLEMPSGRASELGLQSGGFLEIRESPESV